MKLRFLVTGSTLHSDSPGDLDLMGVIPNEEFEHHFGYDHVTFQEAFRKSPTPSLLVNYLEQCKGAKMILECLFDKRHIDFKFVPETIPYGDVKEITLCDLKTLD